MEQKLRLIRLIGHLLEGKSVIIWPDNDDAGKEYGKKVSEYLKTKGLDIKVIDSTY